jgi:hypothetical protein
MLPTNTFRAFFSLSKMFFLFLLVHSNLMEYICNELKFDYMTKTLFKHHHHHHPDE